MSEEKPVYPPYPPPQQPYPTADPAPAMGTAGYPPPGGQAYYTAPTTNYPPPTTATTTIILSGPGFGLGPDPFTTQCPNCHAQIVTETYKKTTGLAWVICVFMVVFGCIFGCCLIPFCIDSLKDTEHRCPQCKHYIGIYRPPRYRGRY